MTKFKIISLCLITALFFLNKTCFAKNSDLIITEVFPNPSGSDKNAEWIEFYNPGSKEIDLANWQLNINAKTTKISGKIEAKNFKSIKLTLPNTATKIKLLDSNNNYIQEINYKQAPENLSYSQTGIQSKNKIESVWFWTTPSKNRKNPGLIEIQGTITSPITTGKEFHFEIDQQTVVINEIDFDISLTEELIRPGKKIAALIQKNGKTNILKKFKILNDIDQKERPAKQINNKVIYYLLAIVLALSFLLFFS